MKKEENTRIRHIIAFYVVHKRSRLGSTDRYNKRRGKSIEAQTLSLFKDVSAGTATRSISTPGKESVHRWFSRWRFHPSEGLSRARQQR